MNKTKSLFRVYYFSKGKKNVGTWLYLHEQTAKSKFKGGALELVLNVLAKTDGLRFESNYHGQAGLEVLDVEDSSVYNVTIDSSAPEWVRIFAYQVIFSVWQRRGSVLLKDIPVYFLSRSLALDGRLSDLLPWEYDESETSLFAHYFFGNQPEWIKNLSSKSGLYTFYQASGVEGVSKLRFLENLFVRCLISKTKILTDLNDVGTFPVNVIGTRLYAITDEEIASRRKDNLSREIDESVDLVNILTQPFYKKDVAIGERLREMAGVDQYAVRSEDSISYVDSDTRFCEACQNDPCVCSDPKFSTLDDINILN